MVIESQLPGAPTDELAKSVRAQELHGPLFPYIPAH